MIEISSETQAKMDAQAIICKAQKELREEQFRKHVEQAKEKLRRPWWIKLFPWRIKLTITRR